MTNTETTSGNREAIARYRSQTDELRSLFDDADPDVLVNLVEQLRQWWEAICALDPADHTLARFRRGETDAWMDARLRVLLAIAWRSGHAVPFPDQDRGWVHAGVAPVGSTIRRGQP